MKADIRGVYAIIDNTSAPHRSHRDLALACLKGGIRILQLRMKGERGISERERRASVLRTAREIRRLKSEFDFTFIINDCLETALELKADGFHGGKDDPPIQESRRLLGEDVVIGYSAHSPEEAIWASRQGADYVAFGAIYRSFTKGVDHPVQGVEKLKKVVRALKVPVVAIGGLSRDNMEEVLATGVASVAMIQSLVGVPDTVNEAKRYVSLFADNRRRDKVGVA